MENLLHDVVEQVSCSEQHVTSHRRCEVSWPPMLARATRADGRRRHTCKRPSLTVLVTLLPVHFSHRFQGVPSKGPKRCVISSHPFACLDTINDVRALA